MYNPEYCKQFIDKAWKELFNPEREDSSILNWYWASALIEWSTELKKVEDYLKG
jgi:hypothetical protein